MRRFDSESLRIRLQALAGSEPLEAFGWAVLGMRNVLAGATPTALVLETVALSFESRSVERLEYSRIQGFQSCRGDTTVPGWARINLQTMLMSSMTSSLVVKPFEEPPRSYLFRPMPGQTDNREAGARIAGVLEMRAPHARGFDIREYRREHGHPMRWLRWGAACAAAGAAAMGFGLSNAAAAAGGAVLGFAAGAAVSLAWSAMAAAAGGRG
jgi:hypothetical protein